MLGASLEYMLVDETKDIIPWLKYPRMRPLCFNSFAFYVLLFAAAEKDFIWSCSIGRFNFQRLLAALIGQHINENRAAATVL
jgi:hypothetical protein